MKKTATTPAPAPRKTNRRHRVNPWLKLAGFSIGGMFSAWLLFQFFVKVIHPYKLGYEESRQVEVLRNKLKTQQARNDDLARRVAYLRSSEGAEREARRLGYHRPGETVYLLDQDALSEANATPAAPVAPAP